MQGIRKLTKFYRAVRREISRSDPKRGKAGRPQPKSVGRGTGILPMSLGGDGRDVRAPCPNQKSTRPAGPP